VKPMRPRTAVRAAATVAATMAATVAAAQDAGATLYDQQCAVCHAAKGEGIPGFAPRLAGELGARAAKASGREYFAQLVVSGMMGPIVSGGERYNDAMPAFASLPDGQLVAILGYVLGELNGVAPEHRVSAQDLAAARQRALAPNEVRKLRDR